MKSVASIEICGVENIFPFEMWIRNPLDVASRYCLGFKAIFSYFFKKIKTNIILIYF
jgi:hypothetical protein